MASYSKVKYIKHKENPTSFKKGDSRLVGNKFREGKSAWNKGKAIRLNPKNEFKKGHIPWNKGLKGYKTGENHYNWKGGRGSERHRLMIQLEYKLWRKAVFERDNYTCRICFKKGGYLEADHIKSWSLFPELRYAIDNGRTLCKKCHSQTDSYPKQFIPNLIRKIEV